MFKLFMVHQGELGWSAKKNWFHSMNQRALHFYELHYMFYVYLDFSFADATQCALTAWKWINSCYLKNESKKLKLKLKLKETTLRKENIHYEFLKLAKDICKFLAWYQTWVWVRMTSKTRFFIAQFIHNIAFDDV